MDSNVLSATIIAIGMVISVSVWKGIEYLDNRQTIEEIQSSLSNIKMPKIGNALVKYKKVWIDGKSLGECMIGHKELNATVQRCRNGYFDTVKIQ